MKICVTGGIGSGKSELVEILRRHGQVVVSADAVNAEMLADPAYQKKLAKIFPGCVVNGVVDRRTIRDIIVVDEEKRIMLNALSHDEIFLRMQEKTAKEPLVFFEVPMLDKSREDDFDRVWFVTADDEVRVDRIMTRDGCNREAAIRIIEVQRQFEDIIPRADAIIHNDGDLCALESEVTKLLTEVRGYARQ